MVAVQDVGLRGRDGSGLGLRAQGVAWFRI